MIRVENRYRGGKRVQTALDICGYLLLFHIDKEWLDLNGGKLRWAVSSLKDAKVVDLRMAFPKVLLYSKDKLGWNYEADTRIVIKYTVLGLVFYRLRSQHIHTKDIFTFKKTKHEKRRESFIEIGKQEFKEVYNNNKWIIPINFKLNLELK